MGYVNMAEENVEDVQQDVAMFWTLVRVRDGRQNSQLTESRW